MEKIRPLVSVIVPNYNHAPFLQQRLESIFNQTFQDFEVIILDDCSTDNSKEIIEQYRNHPKVSHIIYNTYNSGSTFIQWNKGIELASGKYIWIAESDDYCTLDFIEKLLPPIEKDDKISLVYCQSNKVNEKSEIMGNWIDYTRNLSKKAFLNDFVMDGNHFIEKYLLHKNVIPNASAVLFRKKRAIEIGKLDSDVQLHSCGDWLHYFKLIINNKVGFHSESLNYFRYHSNSVVSTTIQKNNILNMIDINTKMRHKMVAFVSLEKPMNLQMMIRINNQCLKEGRLYQAHFYIYNKESIKGFLILVTVFDIYIKFLLKRIYSRALHTYKQNYFQKV
jgi:glycosyltransferase involved in cell wall biosynthesis